MSYNDKSSFFQKLLEKYNSVTIHCRKIKALANETYKFLQGFSAPLMNDIFVERNNNYSLQGNKVLTGQRLNSAIYGNETVSFLARKIWDILPKESNGFCWNALADFVKHMCCKWDLTG